MITVPEALRNYKQFILHHQKIPCDYRTGKPANAHDSAIWLDADTALQIAELWGEGYGIGFVFTENDPLWFLDMDHCLENGQWSPLSLQLFEYLKGAYCEISQSGTGGHIIGSGTPPTHCCKNIHLGLELYHSGRFCALTGNGAIGDASFDASALLPGLVATYFPPDDAKTGAQEWTTEPCPEWHGPTDDDELIRRMLQSRSTASTFGSKASFADLWNANTEALAKFYPDPSGSREYDASSADMALAQHLAFRTGKDCERIRSLMERSALKRDKWKREDYLPRTILTAVARQIDVLQDKRPESTLNGIETNLLHHGTQDSVAQIFTQRMAGKMLFNHTRKAWHEWDGTRWRLEQTDKAFDFARDLARQANSECKSSIGSAPFCTGVERMARADRALAVAGTEFDRDNYLLNTPNGTIDLRTGALRPHNPDDRITLSTAVSPCAQGGAAFEKFLTEITQNDRALAELLQVSLGACLSGAVESHWMLFWIGQGRNGKNTLGDLIMDAMGDYARKVPMSTLVAKLHEGHPTEVANLQGVRLAVSSEINEGAHWDEARINELTGDATLSARFMRGDFFQFKRTHKHLIYGNHRPQLRAVGDAIKSRIKIVPFRESFVGREDADLPRRLRENLGYVLGWLVEGHRKWLASGKRLPRCQSVEEETADYFASQSTVEMWQSECLEILTSDNRPASSLPKAGDLYNHYKTWKEARGERPESMSQWSESMRMFEKIRSNGVRYRGLMLIPQGREIPFPLSPGAQVNRAN